MDGEQYERLIEPMADSFYSQKTETDFEVKRGHSNWWKGASGFCHQIDVSLRSERKIILIECKCWHDLVTPEKLLVFLGRIIDIRNTLHNVELQGVMICALGITKEAEKIADYYNINVQVVYDYGHDDRWEILPDGHMRVIHKGDS